MRSRCRSVSIFARGMQRGTLDAGEPVANSPRRGRDSVAAADRSAEDRGPPAEAIAGERCADIDPQCQTSGASSRLSWAVELLHERFRLGEARFLFGIEKILPSQDSIVSWLPTATSQRPWARGGGQSAAFLGQIQQRSQCERIYRRIFYSYTSHSHSPHSFFRGRSAGVCD